MKQDYLHSFEVAPHKIVNMKEKIVTIWRKLAATTSKE